MYCRFAELPPLLFDEAQGEFSAELRDGGLGPGIQAWSKNGIDISSPFVAVSMGKIFGKMMGK